MTERDELFNKSQEFFQMLSKQKEFIQDIINENKSLRTKLAGLEAQFSTSSTPLDQEEIRVLKKRIMQLEAEKKALDEKSKEVEAENKDFAQRYIEIEEQNNNLANLYVASYQLHSTLDLQEVIHIVMEIIINLIGAEAFSIMLIDEKTNELGVVSSEGYPDGTKYSHVRLGDGVIGKVAKSGEPYYINQATGPYEVDFLHPIACIPLKIKENCIGVINIHKLLVQKDAFTAIDYELFSLLAAHAATSIFSSRLYSQSERKLMTIQGFLDLITTGAEKA